MRLKLWRFSTGCSSSIGRSSPSAARGSTSRRSAREWTNCRRPPPNCGRRAPRSCAEREWRRARDPLYSEQGDRSNPARVVRALEVCLQTGRPFSELRLGRRRERPFDIVKIGIEVPREELYERINRRVDAMMAEGLEAEARALYPYRHLNALRTVGYRELFDFFEGRCSRDEAVEAIKRNTRRYAKRQMTWFRRDGEIRWFRRDDLEAMFRHVDFGES